MTTLVIILLVGTRQTRRPGVDYWLSPSVILKEIFGGVAGWNVPEAGVVAPTTASIRHAYEVPPDLVKQSTALLSGLLNPEFLPTKPESSFFEIMGWPNAGLNSLGFSYNVNGSSLLAVRISQNFGLLIVPPTQLSQYRFNTFVAEIPDPKKIENVVARTSASVFNVSWAGTLPSVSIAAWTGHAGLWIGTVSLGQIGVDLPGSRFPANHQMNVCTDGASVFFEFELKEGPYPFGAPLNPAE